MTNPHLSWCIVTSKLDIYYYVAFKSKTREGLKRGQRWVKKIVPRIGWLEPTEVSEFFVYDLVPGEVKGVPVVARWKRIRLTFMRTQVPSLASFSGLRIWRCCQLWCRLQTRLGSDMAVAVVQASGYHSDSMPSLRTSMCLRCGPKKTKSKENKTKNKSE